MDLFQTKGCGDGSLQMNTVIFCPYYALDISLMIHDMGHYMTILQISFS